MSNSNVKNTNADYLATLPYDIICEMVSHMGISTVDKLTNEVSYLHNSKESEKNKYDGVKDACGNRKSVVKYLSKHFGDGVALLEAMSKYFVYISGSRSLNFFEEGHIREDSDWDFYVSNWPGHVIGIMKELEKLGVVWMSPKEEMRDLKAVGKGSLVVESSKLEHLLRNGSFAAEDRDTVTDIADTIQRVDVPNFTISFNNGDLSAVPNEAGSGYTSDKMTCIIRGKLHHKGTITRVQLISESRNDSNASIVAPFSYHSSCVQSFIGPYAACHMYGRLTSEGKSYGWRNNISMTARNRLSEYNPSIPVEVSSVPGWSKYTDRGFEYINPPEWNLGFELRSVEDHESIWLQYDEHTDAPPDVVTLYTQVSRGTAWYQVTDGTIPVHFPIKSTHNHDKLDFGSWFIRNNTLSSEVSEYLDTYIPHLQYSINEVMIHISEPWE
jgi:hypothetical protein